MEGIHYVTKNSSHICQSRCIYFCYFFFDPFTYNHKCTVAFRTFTIKYFVLRWQSFLFIDDKCKLVSSCDEGECAQIAVQSSIRILSKKSNTTV